MSTIRRKSTSGSDSTVATISPSRVVALLPLPSPIPFPDCVVSTSVVDRADDGGEFLVLVSPADHHS